MTHQKFMGPSVIAVLVSQRSFAYAKFVAQFWFEIKYLVPYLSPQGKALSFLGVVSILIIYSHLDYNGLGD